MQTLAPRHRAVEASLEALQINLAGIASSVGTHLPAQHSRPSPSLPPAVAPPQPPTAALLTSAVSPFANSQAAAVATSAPEAASSSVDDQAFLNSTSVAAHSSASSASNSGELPVSFWALPSFQSPLTSLRYYIPMFRRTSADCHSKEGCKLGTRSVPLQLFSNDERACCQRGPPYLMKLSSAMLAWQVDAQKPVSVRPDTEPLPQPLLSQTAPPAPSG